MRNSSGLRVPEVIRGGGEAAQPDECTGLGEVASSGTAATWRAPSGAEAALS
ncbi:hypothetical protein [Streptomyces clavifer]|uniref:hypothetical protein n=1 Tax=Streptomyces clavifer TaxID=68188 RepID=UPI00380F8924